MKNCSNFNVYCYRGKRRRILRLEKFSPAIGSLEPAFLLSRSRVPATPNPSGRSPLAVKLVTRGGDTLLVVVVAVGGGEGRLA